MHLSFAIIFCARRTAYLFPAADSAAGLSPSVHAWNLWKEKLYVLIRQANAVHEMAKLLDEGIGEDSRIKKLVEHAVSAGQCGLVLKIAARLQQREAGHGPARAS